MDIKSHGPDIQDDKGHSRLSNPFDLPPHHNSNQMPLLDMMGFDGHHELRRCAARIGQGLLHTWMHSGGFETWSNEMVYGDQLQPKHLMLHLHGPHIGQNLELAVIDLPMVGHEGS